LAETKYYFRHREGGHAAAFMSGAGRSFTRFFSVSADCFGDLLLDAGGGVVAFVVIEVGLDVLGVVTLHGSTRGCFPDQFQLAFTR